MVHKAFCFAVFFYYYIPLFFTVSTQNSFTKIKSVLRFLAVCRTVLGGRNAHDGFENTVKMIDIIEATGVADVQHTVVCLREHFHGLTDTLFVTTEPAPTTVWSPNTRRAKRWNSYRSSSFCRARCLCRADAAPNRSAHGSP